MLDQLIEFDIKAFLFLNNLGSTTFDFFWVLLSNKTSNILVYVLISFMYYKKKGINFLILILFFSVLMILVTDQTTNLFKFSFERLRPCHDESLYNLFRLPNNYCGGKYGFFSGHSSNSFALATFFGLIFLNFNKYITYILFLIASLIAYSRIYLGVHFLLDVISGSIFGIISGYFFYKTSSFLFKIFYSNRTINF